MLSNQLETPINLRSMLMVWGEQSGQRKVRQAGEAWKGDSANAIVLPG